MAGFQIVIEPTALEDIEEVLQWLSDRAPHKVSEWLNNLHDSIQTLDTMPERCPLAPENGQWGPEVMRQLLFDEYPSK